MKKKYSRIGGVGLVVMLLVSLLIAAAPTSAGTLAFGTETLPGATGVKIAPSAGFDILDLAANGDTLYAATGDGNGDTAIGVTSQKIYKSTDGGATWAALTPPDAINSATDNVDSINMVAVAPDDPDIVAFLGNISDNTTNLTCYVSVDGGSNWSSLSTIQDSAGTQDAVACYDIAISPQSSGIHYIAVAGAATLGNSEDPGLWYYNLGATVGNWADAVTEFDPVFPTASEVDLFQTVAFSPYFPSDLTMLAVSVELGDSAIAGELALQAASFNTETWNAGSYSTYPGVIETDAAAADNWTPNVVNMVLAPDYLGGDDTTHVVFIAASITDVATEDGGLYRMDETDVTELSTTGMRSVDYDGINLVAGAYATNVVYRSADPLVGDPTVSAARTYKRPGLENASKNEMPVVAWVGSNVVSVSSGDASSCAISTDNGLTFNDVSLVDSAFTYLDDFAVTLDAAKVYLVSRDAVATSLWREDDGWQRVFCTAADENWIVRVSPDDNDVLYLALTGGTDIYYTKDAGETKWTIRASRYAIGDVAVESTDVAYVAVDGAKTVSKTPNGGFTWDSAASTGMTSTAISMISSLGVDQLIVGGTTGYVAYSDDGNVSWTDIGTQLTGAGAPLLTQVTASGLADGDYIYAATSEADTLVERWEIGEDGWTDMAAPLVPTTTDQAAFGIALQDNILYVVCEDLAASDNNSLVVRALGPDDPTWSSMASAGETFDAAPSALRVSTASSTKLWFIDTLGMTLDSFTDTLVGVSVALASPSDGFQNPMNPVTGRSVDLAFSWTRPSSNVSDYEIGIYDDAACTTQIQLHPVNSTGTTPVVVMGPYQAINDTQFVEFSPGRTYYWRVRVTSAGPVVSEWSEIRSLTIEPGVALVPKILSPANGGSGTSLTPSFSWDPVSGATDYNFKMSEAVSLANAMVDVTVSYTGYMMLTDLDYDTTYYWSVKPVAPVEGGWSAVANFTTMAEPVEPAPPFVIEQVQPPAIIMPDIVLPAPQEVVIPAAPTPPAPIAPAYIWAIIIVGAILAIAVVVLIIRTRRVA